MQGTGIPNIQIGEDRPLQLLDDSAQELHGAIWSVDNPENAEIREEDGRAATCESQR